MTWTRSNSVGRGAGSAPAALARRAVRWGAAGVATAAAVATGLGGVTAASAATAISIPVPCSVTALNAAITFSPSNTILVLKPGCIYVTSGPLSNINRNLTIVGSNDTIRLTGAGTILHVNHAQVGISQLTFTGGDGSGSEPGAIHNVGGTLSLTSTTFRDNDGGYGGAIQNSSGGALTISSSTFADNDASVIRGGGAIADRDSSTTSVTGTTFFGNEGGNGGAIYNYSGILTFPTSTAQSTFRDNTADGGGVFGNGGAIANRSGQANADNANFVGNSANNNGGALYNVGGTSTISNSGFSGNRADNGGAIYTSTSLNLVGDTISGNRASLRGGGIYVRNGHTTLSQNTLVVGNFAGITGGGIYRQSGTVSFTTGAAIGINFPNNCTGLICI